MKLRYRQINTSKNVIGIQLHINSCCENYKEPNVTENNKKHDPEKTTEK